MGPKVSTGVRRAERESSSGRTITVSCGSAGHTCTTLNSSVIVYIGLSIGIVVQDAELLEWPPADTEREMDGDDKGGDTGGSIIALKR